MNIADARTQIDLVEQRLKEIGEITSSVAVSEDGETRTAIDQSAPMDHLYPAEDAQVRVAWEDVQRNIPPGFSIGGNLLRHLHFNEAGDWFDIATYDIPHALSSLQRYKKQLVLVEWLNSLHPEIRRAIPVVLEGDLDAALKVVYAALDSKVRLMLGVSSAENTVPAIGKAFREGRLVAPDPTNNDAARNFLMGAIGYYRNMFVHNTLPQERTSIELCMPFFGIAHEAFELLDLSIPEPPGSIPF